MPVPANMFPEQNNLWHPTASLNNLKERAKLLHAIRSFFNSRGVFEVDTPLLCRSTVTDVFLDSFCVKNTGYFLQTSPEYAMKRLIAAFNQPIYYLGKVFREGELGRKHNPEFTMLEWYRPQWDHSQLIEEMNALFQDIFKWAPLEITTYQAIFQKYLNIDPLSATELQLKNLALKHHFIDDAFECDRDGWLNLLLTHGIESQLGLEAPIAILDYPCSQGALAKTRQDLHHGFEVAERFEIYYKGVELANGYHELTCPIEQERRFEIDNCERQKRGLSAIPVDNLLLDALKSGLKNCAGVAVGFDRLLMIKLGAAHISEVIPFNWENA